jgi:hypothetical protein
LSPATTTAVRITASENDSQFAATITTFPVTVVPS